MWIITKFGFFSVVQKPGQKATGTLTVRGRVQADLEAFRAQYLPTMAPVETDAGTDYKYRAVAPAAQVAAAMCAAVADIDYANFKNAVAVGQGSTRSKLYQELWDTLWKLDEFDATEQAAIEVDLAQEPPSPETDAAGVGSRFVDTEDDLACWGISPSTNAGEPVRDRTEPTSFGGVVFDGSGRVLLRKPAGEFDGYVWTFPKGRPDHGETPDATAVREVREETGIQAIIVGAVPGTFRGGTSLTTYYRMTPVQDFGDHDRAETEQIVWADPAEAHRLIAQTRNAVGRQRDWDVLAAAVARVGDVTPPELGRSIPPSSVVPHRMTETGVELEVAITHKLKDKGEVRTLWERQWIALDFGRRGSDPSNYRGRARSQIELFNRIAKEGAAVVGIYRKATPKRSDRLIGLVRPGTTFRDLNGLLCLPLSDARVVDASISFVGNLVPRMCTVQPCGNRAVGKLRAVAHGRPVIRTVTSLHHLDVEWLVTNWMITSGLCTCVWAGSKSFEDVDHVGVSSGGATVLAQTTVSSHLVEKKAKRLLRIAGPERHLYLFAPAEAKDSCPKPVQFVALDDVFSQMDATSSGRWLINRMVSAEAGPPEPLAEVGSE